MAVREYSPDTMLQRQDAILAFCMAAANAQATFFFPVLGPFSKMFLGTKMTVSCLFLLKEFFFSWKDYCSMEKAMLFAHK